MYVHQNCDQCHVCKCMYLDVHAYKFGAVVYLGLHEYVII